MKPMKIKNFHGSENSKNFQELSKKGLETKEKQSFSESQKSSISEKPKVFQKKVLYIEDNEDTADAVKAMLTHAGFETYISLSGKDGIRKAKNGFDLVLIDIMLPDMSGWDVFTKLNKKTKAKFAFLSAIPVSKERMNELKKAGISDYITKPFEKDDLIKRIKKILK